MDYHQLVRDCLKGQAPAQKQLYDHFAPTMLGICYRYTKSMSDAEDVLQEGFIMVFKNLHQFSFSGELGGWIRRIMVNTAINYLKKNSRYQTELLFTDSVLHPVATEDPEVLLNAKELAELIRQLPPGYQAIFNMHAVEGYSHVEIGRMMGINEGTSRSQYSRARALLISWIKKFSAVNKNETYARP
ncbi:MAG: RNA polymerase sigma factor [Bacteroidota bacterium]|nr:RNA polymerase sigma factor [Bacteroidota bacterium]MDP4215886.1 RNA polymerase sigma factor [Bacteroidota bacterium]MDP4246808.1 RNA polymerase sigma factor [Bacteroidota bacterium]MDP4254685.1 RNA polymerase sigma factor [Bacteroidota bacterium]MDP4259534.1 RNA polymerase sigma factor [Bacteroidota bacterium]